MSKNHVSSATEANDKNLVKVKQRKIGKNLINAVDARELHCFLGSQRNFSHWIKYRIEQYSFQEGVDFRTILSKSPNGRPLKEYLLSLDMAKELCIMGKNLLFMNGWILNSIFGDIQIIKRADLLLS